jgi:HK97 family phage portal protein
MSILSRLTSLFGAERRSIENPNVPVSAQQFYNHFVAPFMVAGTGVSVTTETALGVPAVAAAVGFLSETIATLPIDVYRRDGEARVAVNDSLSQLLNRAPNGEITSFDWRATAMTQVLTTGRAFTFVERNALGRVAALWLLDPAGVTVERIEGRRRYRYRDGGREVIYSAAEIIDIRYGFKADGLGHYAPVGALRNAIGLAISLESYAAKIFQNGGIPPLALEGPIASESGARKAAADVVDAVKRAGMENRAALVMPSGHKLVPIGFDPDKQQMVEARRFQLEEIARVYRLPPVFLQDLTHGTYTNTEQQDLHVVKHRIMQIVRQWEQQLNLKLFGPGRSSRYVEFNQDALLRGDFVARMEGMAKAIQHGLLTPNEGRRMDNREDMPGGDRLLVQGAMVPLDAGARAPVGAAGDQSEDNGDDNAQ